jgi:hypothetical protein
MRRLRAAGHPSPAAGGRSARSEIFRDKAEGCLKVVLSPERGARPPDRRSHGPFEIKIFFLPNGRWFHRSGRTSCRRRAGSGTSPGVLRYLPGTGRA